MSKEVKTEMKKQGEQITALHQAVVSSQHTETNKPSETESEDEITYKDKRLQARVHKEDDHWLWDYKINQKIKFNLVESKQENGVMHFRVKATDEISGETLKVEDFKSKITLESPRWQFYIGGEMANNTIGVSLGAVYKKYFIYGRISGNGDRAVGVMKRIEIK